MNFDLKGKLGPLPVWAWGVIVGLVLVAGVFMYRKQNSANTASTSIQGAAIDPQGYQTEGITGGSASEPDLTDTYEYESNASWLNKAAADVADFLAASPSAIYAALRKYLTGEALSPKERQYVDAALTRTGNPPEGTYGISDTVVRSLGYAAVKAETGGYHRFEIYDDGSRRYLPADEINKLGIGDGSKLTQYTLADLKAKFPTGRSDDPA